VPLKFLARACLFPTSKEFCNSIGQEGCERLGLSEMKHKRNFTVCHEAWTGLKPKEKKLIQRSVDEDSALWFYERSGVMLKNIIKRARSLLRLSPFETQDEQEESDGANTVTVHLPFLDRSVKVSVFLGDLRGGTGHYTPATFEKTNATSMLASLPYGLSKHPGDLPGKYTSEGDLKQMVEHAPSLTTATTFILTIFHREQDDAMVRRVLLAHPECHEVEDLVRVI
jgi:hypothetical protein